MKILHISIYPAKNSKHGDFGGVAGYTKNLLTNLPTGSKDQNLILANIFNKSETYNEENISVIRCFDRSPKFIFQLLKEIKRVQPDIVHLQQELGLFGGVITAVLLQFVLLFCKPKKVITMHGVVAISEVNPEFIKENNSKLPVWLIKIAFWVIYKPLTVYANHIIVHENLFKDRLIKEYGTKADKISVIPHGVEDLELKNKETTRNELKLPSRSLIVLFMGYLTGYKGLDMLIEGFAEYVKVNPRSFLILGAGLHPKLKDNEEYLNNEYYRLQNKAKELIPASNYDWRGFIPEDEMVDYYSAADLSIYPYTSSLSSSGPMSIAMSYGAPFLASDVFGNFIENKDLLFERNPEAIKNALLQFDPTSAAKTSQEFKQARLWSIVGAKTREVYEKLDQKN
jgi:glycosyltransferase involved in cell wall biosynthesis